MFKRLLATLLSVGLLLTLFPTIAHADGDYVGNGEDGVVGEDTEKGSNWDGHSGAWRIYIADEAGSIVKNPVDVTNLPEPQLGIKVYMTDKLRGRNSSTLSGLSKYGGKWNASIPAINASQEDIIAFWESNNFDRFRVLCGLDGMNWNADEILAKVQSKEWFIVIEPVFWFTIRGTYYAMTPTEMAIMNDYAPGYMTYMKNLTHRHAPLKAYFPSGKGKWGIPGATGSEASMAANNNFYLPNATIKAQYGIARVESIGGMCCPHPPTDCACYSNATPPNLNPPEAPAKCKCFETHLKDPNNPIPCGPGVPNCDCYPPQCCEHPPSCPCQPGKHKDNDPTCECPDTHPGIPCGPNVPDCDCYPHGDDINTDLIIHEDEMTQALNAKMEAKGTKLQVRSVPAFQPASGGFKGSSCSCNGYTKKGRHKGDSGYHQYYNWVAPTVWEASGVTLNPNVSTKRDYMGEADQYKIIGKLADGSLRIAYANSQLTDTYPGSSGSNSGALPTGPFDNENTLHFIGHRQGAHKSPIPIAAYMGATSSNTSYKTLITCHKGSSLTEDTFTRVYEDEFGTPYRSCSFLERHSETHPMPFSVVTILISS